MTDYRMRNADLLYAGAHRPVLNRRSLAIFGSIALAAAVSIASYLTDYFNPATAGFKTTAPSLIARQAPKPVLVPVVQLTPADPSGS